MAQIWNRYHSSFQEVKGGIPVWVEIPKKRVSGGMLKNKIKDMEVLASGSPQEFNHLTHESKILKCFEILSVEETGENTIVILKRTSITPLLYPGMNVMVEPSRIDGSGKGTVVLAVDESVPNEYQMTVALGSLDTPNEGKFIVEAAEEGAAVKMFCQPNNLTMDDTVGGEQNSVGVPRGMKYIYENMIPAMPQVVKDNIKFVEWETFPEK